MGLVILSVAGTVVFWAVMHLTLNRGSDRLQLATVCLALALLGYVALAWQLHERGSRGLWVAVVLAFSAAIYVCVGALAIFHYRWAWRLCVAALALHLSVSTLGLVVASTLGATAVLAAAQSFILGAVALWACLHPGSRSMLVPPRPSSAA